MNAHALTVVPHRATQTIAARELPHCWAESDALHQAAHANELCCFLRNTGISNGVHRGIACGLDTAAEFCVSARVVCNC